LLFALVSMDTERPDVEPRRGTRRIALGALLGVTFLLVAWMAAPLLVGLALGTVIGFTAQPAHARLAARLGQRRALAAALMTLFSAVVLLASITAVGWALARELIASAPAMERGLAAGPDALLGPGITRFLETVHVSRDVIVERLQAELGRLSDILGHAAGAVMQASAGVLLTFVIGLWTTYYVLIDWPHIAQHLESLLPLDPKHTRALVAEFRDVGRRAFVGSVVTACIQGTLAGIGFAVMGVPRAALWGAALAVTSFIPVIGTLLVWVPAAVWLLSTGDLVRALLLTAWCLVFVMAANDYVIKPRLVGGRSDAHPLLMLVAIIGGITVFGVAGVIVGPVVMSLFVATARIYERERHDEATVVGRSEPPGERAPADSSSLRLHRAEAISLPPGPERSALDGEVTVVERLGAQARR
jgi:predicted PurR-regulated permease PerM